MGASVPVSSAPQSTVPVPIWRGVVGARVPGNREMVLKRFQTAQSSSSASESSVFWRVRHGVLFLAQFGDWVPHAFMAYPMQKATQSELDSSLEDSIP